MKKVTKKGERQWIHSTEDVLRQTLFVSIDGKQITICLSDFNEEDRTRLAFQGLLVKIQRATAGKKSRDEKVSAALRKARELAEGKLVSDRASVVQSVMARIVAKMREAGFTDEQIREVFPDWEG